MKKVLIIISILLVIIGGLFGFGYRYYLTNLLAVDDNDQEEILFVVENNQTIKSVLEKLETENLIKNKDVAYVYMRLNGINNLFAGTYLLKRSYDTNEVLKILNTSNEQVLITLPEGIWAKDIAATIANNTNVKADELIELWNDKEFLKQLQEKYPFLPDDIFKSGLKVALEGYLFPESLYFYKISDPKAITYRLLDHTNEVLNQYREKIDQSNLSLHEIITLASIVEFEASDEKDLKMIAGVFYNRLNQNMKLQSSATVCYALYEKFTNWQDCEKNSQIESDYNTYIHFGIPLGPINNPSKKAIEAVLEPIYNDYLYFMADVKGDNKIYYSKTYEEHQALIEKYLN